MYRYAIVRTRSEDEVEFYLPINYHVRSVSSSMPDGQVDVLIFGKDEGGWTLDGYVLPRLASGLIYGHEYKTKDEALDALASAMN
jgi:hypothetical protein